MQQHAVTDAKLKIMQLLPLTLSAALSPAFNLLQRVQEILKEVSCKTSHCFVFFFFGDVAFTLMLLPRAAILHQRPALIGMCQRRREASRVREELIRLKS